LKEVVSNLYPEYLRYIDSFRAIPWVTDALKPVERRLLLAVHDVAKSKFTKCAKIVGHSISNYHPHGDLSTYETLVTLVNRGFVVGQGNFGAIGLDDMSSAAMRYTECKANTFLNNLFTEFLEFAPWQELELDNEPLYLPSPVPIGLVGEGITSGIANNTCKIPRYNYVDLLTRTRELISNSTTKTTIQPIIAGCNVYEDSPGEFEKILTTGEGIIQCVPHHKTISNSVFIYGRNPLTGYSKLKSFNSDYEEKNGSPLYTVVDLSDSKLCIQVTPIKGKADANFELQIAKLISTKIHILCNFVDNDYAAKLFSIDQVIIKGYNAWKNCYLLALNSQLNKLSQKLLEYNVILIIRQIIENYPKLKTVDDYCKQYLSSNFINPNISTDNIREVASKHRIKTLIEADIDIPQIQQEIAQTQQNISNINQLAFDRISQ
jgi:DNA gyrase/topoisomerase IV subunit A